jgi:hypothetical protein
MEPLTNWRRLFSLPSVGSMNERLPTASICSIGAIDFVDVLMPYRLNACQ